MTTDAEFVEFQGHLNLIFARARTFWKESAARVHPELPLSGYKLLMFISRVGSSNAQEIAASFDMDKSMISRHVRMLEDLGLIESRSDDDDARLRVLTTTPTAEAALAETRAEHAHRVRAALGDVAPDEIASATRVLRALVEM